MFTQYVSEFTEHLIGQMVPLWIELAGEEHFGDEPEHLVGGAVKLAVHDTGNGGHFLESSTLHASALISASACSSQYIISISRYIVVGSAAESGEQPMRRAVSILRDSSSER
jgi:hypothetical protein